MKKIIFSFILGVGFGAFGYASQSKPQSDIAQKQEPTKAKKYERIDFSLYKFIVPKASENTDSLKQTTPQKGDSKLKDETTFNYEKPFTFFKFS